ncbi:hypothetical protein EDB81DRAFT_672958 [Dactylonectria macrodidyma]|uniref:Uncharacterized protein n=1 Tax=Dactylonectria macrodidyma TaxID=307937 RepID=A0A9P9CYK1_9HYPO|nr:hypothetical protein EDB81DRAFT_672958 [Dactylonectria macrodidyma]
MPSCPLCKITFQRREHLDRHLHRHSGLRPFTCNVCNKSFPRRDTLRRHLVTHGEEAVKAHETARYFPAACQSCARSKQRCDGQSPCGRCRQKGLICAHRRVTKPTHAESVAAMEDEEHRVTTICHQSQASESVSLDLSRSVHNKPAYPSSAATIAQHVTTQDLQGTEDTSVSRHTPRGLAFAPLTGFGSRAHQPSSEAITSLLDFATPSVSASEDIFTEPMSSIGYSSLWTLNDFNPDFLDSSMDFGFTMTSDQLLSQMASATPVPPDPQELPQRVETSGLPKATARSCFDVTSSCLPFPHLEPDDYHTSMSEDYGHVQEDFDVLHARISQFYESQLGFDAATGKSTFVEASIFYGFVQLYYEYFDPCLPFVHRTTLKEGNTAWILYLAMAAIGCQYSAVSHHERYKSGLHDVLHRAVLINMPGNPKTAERSFIEAAVLHHVCMSFDGTQSGIASVQYSKGVLATLQRALLVPRDTLAAEVPEGFDARTRKWHSWIEVESRRRLIYTIWLVECLNYIFLDLRPSLSPGALEESLPSDDNMWRASNAQGWWKCYSGKRGNKIYTVNPTLLSQQFTFNAAVQKLNTFSQLVILMGVYVEERYMKKFAESWLFRHLMSRANGTTTPEDRPDTLNPRMERQLPILEELGLAANHGFECFPSENRPSASGLSSQTTVRKFYHLLSILRQCPLRTLYALSGWQVTASGMDIANREFAAWVHEKPKAARECLWHCSMIFALLRQETMIAFFDPLVLLTAALFLRQYLLEFGSSDTRQQDTGSGGSLRLDRMFDRSHVEPWIQSGTPSSFYITGMGSLSHKGASIRVLKEFHRILLCQQSWIGLSRGIAYTAVQHLHGSIPTFTPE